MKLFVAGLPFDMDDQELQEIFEEYGAVNSAKIILDRETHKSRGFGFVEMAQKADAETAMAKLDGGELSGRKLTVKPAEDKKPGGGGGGGQNFRGNDRNRSRY
jgi:RNA recognition motif-containing protein